MSVLPIHDVMQDCHEAMERLRAENPKAFGQFIAWVLGPSHTQSVVLNFHGHKLQLVERREVIR